jgi:MHS family citrate/tricarballylate:H+ symporter-like MFS transporter
LVARLGLIIGMERSVLPALSADFGVRPGDFLFLMSFVFSFGLVKGVLNFVAGTLSDRIGRKPILVALTVLSLLTAYPVLAWLVSAPSFGRMVSVELWLSFLYAGYNGAMVVALTEIVPATVRTAGFSLAYSLSTTLGGSSLAISTFLIERTGDKAAPGYWLSFAALCGLVATLALYRRGARLPTVPASAIA